MQEDGWLAERFEEHRRRLWAVAYRMLGSPSEADDAVQGAWLRFSRSDTSGVENLGSWLTTVVSRVCLNMLQARRSRPEVPLDCKVPEPITSGADQSDPECEALLADSIGLAVLVVLDTLAPEERVAFVLHDMFAVPFKEIAPIIGRSAPGARQLASRRRRVRGQGALRDADELSQSPLVNAFLDASRNGDFSALLTLLDPDVVLRADEAAVKLGATKEIRGATGVAETFSGRTLGAQPALIDGAAGAVWAPGRRTRVVFRFMIGADKIVGIELIADPEHLREFNLVIAQAPPGVRPSREA